MKKSVWLSIGFAAVGLMTAVSADEARLSIASDSDGKTFTFYEAERPVLTYQFGAVPVPEGMTAPHFGKGAADYDGAYFTDGSQYGGERSDYIHPIYGFNGETLTVDFPADHMHHRGLSWSWCEVRRGEKIGDLWAVCKIRAYPSEITRCEADDNRAVLTAVNFWRFDDESENVVKETAAITVYPTQMINGKKCQAFDTDITLEALVDDISFSGRQTVDYGGYGGMTIRLNEDRANYLLRAIHPNPDVWRGCDADFALRVSDSADLGDSAWMALMADFAVPGQEAKKRSTVMMMEKKSNMMYPNQYRYYGTTCTSLAFPAKTYVFLPKGEPLTYRTRTVVIEGESTILEEKELFDEYQEMP